MKFNWYKLPLIILILGSLLTCIDPFNPNIDKFESLLVVDALVTDENISNYVLLSRTIKSADDVPAKVTGAFVQIKDDVGNATTLKEISKGIYKTDSLEFRGVAGRSYTLYIETDDGEEYESDKCFMWPVQDIDSIYITRGQVIVDTEPRDGIWINIDSKGESACKYYRWKIEEWWKFNVPYPKAYSYDGDVTPYEPLKRTCWANIKAYEIIIKASDTGISDQVKFIASEESDRLLLQYFLEVKQLSISKSEFEFWESMQKINETGGDIFDKHPFQIYSNIHNINRPGEQVLGYFQVSGAKVASRYITQSQLEPLNLPRYKYDCEYVEIGPVDFILPGFPGELPTLAEIYQWYTSEGLTFVWATLFPGPNARFVFVKPDCADCTRRGNMSKPDFWIDMI